MKKFIFLFVLLFCFSACQKQSAPAPKDGMQINKYPCGMSFASYKFVPEQEDAGSEDYIIHLFSDDNYAIAYSCYKNMASGIKEQMKDPANESYKRIIDGRLCFRSAWQNENRFTDRVLCENGDNTESVEVEINLNVDKTPETKKLAEDILSSVNFKQ